MRGLSIHLTDLCNSRCTFCVVGSPLYAKDSVDFQQVKDFLVENSNSGFSHVNLHGGESTIHPRFMEILELIKSLRYPEVHLQTNAIRLSDPEFAHAAQERGVSLFIISLHGDNSQLHDSQTGTPGGFKKTVVGIRNVKALGASVRTNTVVTTQNVDRLPQISGFACDLGVDHINFSNLHPVGSATFAFERITPLFAETRRYLYPAIEVALAASRRVTLEGFPYCTVEKYVSLHLNEEHREIKMLMRGNIIENYDLFMNVKCRVLCDACNGCDVKARCGGVYPEYLARMGADEFHTVTR